MDGIMGRLTAETATLRARLETLTRQSATGMRSDDYGELAPEVPRALSLRAELGRREAYGRTLGQAEGRAAAMQAALNRMGQIAREFGSTVAMSINTRDRDSLATLPARAREALREVGGLLNARHAGEFLFSGSDLANEAVPNAAGLPASAMAAAIEGEVAALAPGNAGAVLAAVRGRIADAALSPFSPRLRADAALAPADREPPRSVPAADGEQIPYGVFANRNSAGVASPAGTAGAGWAHDLLGNLMALAALTPANQGQHPGFDQLVAGIRDGLQSAHDAIAEEQGVLGLTERRMASARDRHETVTAALTKQLADIQEVDLAATLAALQQTRTTLEASYRAIGSLGDLTLARFLR